MKTYHSQEGSGSDYLGTEGMNIAITIKFNFVTRSERMYNQQTWNRGFDHIPMIFLSHLHRGPEILIFFVFSVQQ
jgi:hypothetical protein